MKRQISASDRPGVGRERLVPHVEELGPVEERPDPCPPPEQICSYQAVASVMDIWCRLASVAMLSNGLRVTWSTRIGTPDLPAQPIEQLGPLGDLQRR